MRPSWLERAGGPQGAHPTHRGVAGALAGPVRAPCHLPAVAPLRPPRVPGRASPTPRRPARSHLDAVRYVRMSVAALALERFLRQSVRIRPWLPRLQQLNGVLILVVAVLLLSNAMIRLADVVARLQR